METPRVSDAAKIDAVFVAPIPQGHPGLNAVLEIDGGFAVVELYAGEPVFSSRLFAGAFQSIDLTGEYDVLGNHQFVQPVVRILLGEVNDQPRFVGLGFFDFLLNLLLQLIVEHK